MKRITPDISQESGFSKHVDRQWWEDKESVFMGKQQV